MSIGFYEAVKNRRSIYGIKKESVISDEKLEEVIKHAITYVPTAFNSQSGRVILLLDKEHDKFWDITLEQLRKIVPEEAFKTTEDKINSFKNGYGTVLYFEDQDVVTGLQQKFPLYSDNFPVWSQQGSGMLQYIVWTALEAEGYGASLQHYNEIIEEAIKKELGISNSWKLIGQMPFGKPISEPDKKDFQPIEKRFKVIK